MQTGPNATRSDIVPVVIGGDIGAYALCREFHQAFGVRAIALNTGFIGAIEHSRIIEPRTVASLEPKDVVPAVSAIAQASEGRRVLLVGNTDQLIELLEDIAAQLPKNVTCLCPPRDAFEAVCDKATFSRLCREHGLDVPAMDVVHLAGTDLIAPTQIDFPVVAKPAVSADYYHLIVRGFKKVYYMTEQSQGMSHRIAYNYEQNKLRFEVWEGLDRTDEQDVNSWAIFSDSFRNIHILPAGDGRFYIKGETVSGSQVRPVLWDPEGMPTFFPTGSVILDFLAEPGHYAYLSADALGIPAHWIVDGNGQSLEGRNHYISSHCSRLESGSFFLALTPYDRTASPFLLQDGKRQEIPLNGYLTYISITR